MTSGGPLYDVSSQWHLVFLTTHLAWAISELGFVRAAQRPVASAPRRPTILLLVPISLLLCAMVSYAYPAGRMAISLAATLTASLAMTWFGIGIRMWSLHRPAGTDPIFQNGPRTGGLYRWIEHPAYTGAYLTLLGIALGFGNYLSLGIVGVAATIFFHRLTQHPFSGESESL